MLLLKGGAKPMVLNHCTVCAVYESDQGDQKRIPVKCDGGQILLLLNREQELSDTAKIRIDFGQSYSRKTA